MICSYRTSSPGLSILITWHVMPTACMFDNPPYKSADPNSIVPDLKQFLTNCVQSALCVCVRESCCTTACWATDGSPPPRASKWPANADVCECVASALLHVQEEGGRLRICWCLHNNTLLCCCPTCHLPPVSFLLCSSPYIETTRRPSAYTFLHCQSRYCLIGWTVSFNYSNALPSAQNRQAFKSSIVVWLMSSQVQLLGDPSRLDSSLTEWTHSNIRGSCDSSCSANAVQIDKGGLFSL